MYHAQMKITFEYPLFTVIHPLVIKPLGFGCYLHDCMYAKCARLLLIGKTVT